MDFSAIIAFVKNAIAALLKIFGVEVDTEKAEGFVDNIGSAIEDVKNYGDSLVG